MSTEWMSVNPCKGCSMSGKIAECGNKCNRDKEPIARTLQYLRSWEGHPIDFRDKITQMLKELEASQ